MNFAKKFRGLIPESRRVVVKIGTQVIARSNGKPDAKQIENLVSQIAAIRQHGYEVVVVSSGAVAAGMEALGFSSRPKDVPDMQMCAAVGQARLMALYAQLFFKHKLRVGQLLLTHDDFENRARVANMSRNLEHLIRHGVVPIINENDVVTDEEMKVAPTLGDNDRLAALVVKLIRADLLIILSSVDGVLRLDTASKRRLPLIEKLNREVFKLVRGTAGTLSRGGMDSKLRSAQLVVRAGANVVIANGRKKGVVDRILKGEDIGTLIVAEAN